MLAASLAVLVLVSALVAFGSWPGEGSAKQVDKLLLNDVAQPKPQAVAVRADAVKVARAAELRQAVRARRQGDSRTRSATPGVKTPAGSKPGTTVTDNGTAAPSAGTPAGQLPSVNNTAGSVQQQAQDVTRNVTQNLQQTTQDLGTTVQQGTENVTNQVNQVVDQVVNTVPPPVQQPVQQVTTTVQQVTTGVTDATGGLLGH